MRLIDADALKEKLEEMSNNEWNIQVGSSKGLEDAIDVIDNAPTVEYPFYQEAYQTGYEEGYNEGKNATINKCDNCDLMLKEKTKYDQNTNTNTV